MKKMNKIYEAPKAEAIEIQGLNVLMSSTTGEGGAQGGSGYVP